MLPGGKGCQPRRGERLGVNPTLGNPGNAGGPAKTPQWCQPGPATPGPSGGRKCHTKCHHSGENKPNEMKKFLWEWGRGWGAAILAAAGVQGSCPPKRGPPRPGSTPHRILETPWSLGHGSTPKPGGLRMDMRGSLRDGVAECGGSGRHGGGLNGPRLSLPQLPGGHKPHVHPSAAVFHPHGSAVAQAPVFPCAARRAPPCPWQLPAPIPGCPRSPSCTTDMLIWATAPTAWAQAPVRYFGKDEPWRAWGRPRSGGTGLGCGKAARGGDSTKRPPRPPPARCLAWRHGSAGKPKGRQTAVETQGGLVAPALPPQPHGPQPTRWSRTPAPPAGRRGCGTAGGGWWAMRTPAPGWSSSGAGR